MDGLIELDYAKRRTKAARDFWEDLPALRSGASTDAGAGLLTVLPDILSIADLWKHAADAIVRAAADDRVHDYCAMRATIVPLLQMTIELYAEVAETLDKVQRDGSAVEHAADFRIAHHELQNILAYFADWPEVDPIQRQAVLEEIRCQPVV